VVQETKLLKERNLCDNKRRALVERQNGNGIYDGREALLMPIFDPMK
jgi:hypothetical protein